MPIETRKIRFVCISDTHNATIKLPVGDVLVHAGDLTKQGSLAELKKTIEWLERSDFQAKLVVAGPPSHPCLVIAFIAEPLCV